MLVHINKTTPDTEWVYPNPDKNSTTFNVERCCKGGDDSYGVGFMLRDPATNKVVTKSGH